MQCKKCDMDSLGYELDEAYIWDGLEITEQYIELTEIDNDQANLGQQYGFTYTLAPSLILPLFLFTYHIRFGLNQTWLTLTKSIEKYSNNYTIQHIYYFIVNSIKQIWYCKYYYFFL